MPYWRLSSFYFFYFGSLGALVTFWGLYLEDRGFDPLAIGELMAILMATKIVAPNIWGWIADRKGLHMPLVRAASLLSLLAFLGVFWTRGFWSLALTTTLFSFFWNASLPQIEAVTFKHLGPRVRLYARVRLWGSVGFIVVVALLGWALETKETAIVPWVVLLLYLGTWLSSLTVPEAGNSRNVQDVHRGSMLGLLRDREVLALFSACFLMQASHGVYYAFFSIYLNGHGYSEGMIGGLWALGVLIEVLVFLVMHRLLDRFGARRVLFASLLLAALRWILTGAYPQHVWVMILAQSLHAATFGAFHASAIHLVHHYFTGRFQVRGQALYSSLSFGAGGAVGSLASGLLWTGPGPAAAFWVASTQALIGAAVVWLWVDRARRY